MPTLQTAVEATPTQPEAGRGSTVLVAVSVSYSERAAWHLEEIVMFDRETQWVAGAIETDDQISRG